MIEKGDKVYEIFKSKGYTWGGDWNSLKGYQHFEKKDLDFINYYSNKASWELDKGDFTEKPIRPIWLNDEEEEKNI